MGRRSYGNIDFGPEAKFNIGEYQIRWFDHWLKGKENGIGETAPYRIFVMGDNRWRDEPQWPLDRADEKLLYLTSGGDANTPDGDGRLVAREPGGAQTDRYTYDPEDPVPSLHGPRLFQIPTDQRSLAEREDSLVYQSEPLTERIEVTG